MDGVPGTFGIGVSDNRYGLLVDGIGDARSRGGLELPQVDRTTAPWESSMQATCDCLSWRGALDALERRQAEDALGETVYADFPVQARPALVAAHLLMDRGIITEAELEAKMREVRARFEKE